MLNHDFAARSKEDVTDSRKSIQGDAGGNGRPGNEGVIFNVGRTMCKNNIFQERASILAPERSREDNLGHELI